MKIIETDFRLRNDFHSTWECEQCGHKFKAYGYSDNNFYTNVIPNAICPKCGKSGSGETKEEQQLRLGRTYELYPDEASK